MPSGDGPSASRSTSDRRTVLKATAGLSMAGITGLAGCLGDDGHTVTIATGFEGSTTLKAARALERAINEHSDSVTVTIEQTGGWVANSRLYDDDETDAIGMDDFNAVRAINGQRPYEDDSLEKLPLQGINYDRLENWMMAADGSGIESTDDMVDRQVYVLAPGMGTRVALEEVLRNAGYWDEMERQEMGPGDLAGAISEDRIEALPGQGSMGVDLLGYHQEVDARSDVHAIESSDRFVDGIDETEGVVKLENLEPYGYEQDITQYVDEVTAFGLTAQWRFGPDVAEDAVYEICRVAHEHSDTINEADPTYPDQSDPEMLTSNLDPDQPVHPGAAEYFKDQDVWDSSWEEGEDEFTID